MPHSSKSQRAAQLSHSSNSFTFKPQFICSRERGRDGSITVTLGLSQEQQAKFNARQIVVAGRPPNSPPIEIIDQLAATALNSAPAEWCASGRPILQCDVEIVERSIRPSIKIDGLSFETCRRIHELVADPAADIAALEKALAKTRFSEAKRRAIVAALQAEADARKSDTAAIKKLIETFAAAGEKRADARALAEDFNPKLSPYQFLFAKRQTFLKADQFAKLYDPARKTAPDPARSDLTRSGWDAGDEAKRSADRAAAIIIEALNDDCNIVHPRAAVIKKAWIDFQQSDSASLAAIAQLIKQKVVREFGIGVGSCAKTYIGLDWLIRDEERVAAFLKTNVEYGLSKRQLALIEKVMDDAADLLRRPGFALTPDQRAAIVAVFKSKISIITGPPGVGKTAVLALINAIARTLYQEEENPAWLVALAGRAASNAREAGVCHVAERRVIPLQATTIHRALGIKDEGDGGPNAFASGKEMQTGVAIIEEASMVSTSLFAAIFKSIKARHFVLVGDADQLPPIGAGKPFRDAIASGTLPTTRLAKNWRTDCQGIRDLCADMVRADG